MAAVLSYKKNYSTHQIEKVFEAATTILETYLKADAQFQVNVPQAMFQRCMSVVDKAECKVDPAQRIPPIGVFDECSVEISQLMERGPFARFKRTTAFEGFLRQIRAYLDSDFVDLDPNRHGFYMHTKRASFAPAPSPEQLMDIIFAGGTTQGA